MSLETLDAPIGREMKDRQKMAVTEVNSKSARTIHLKLLNVLKIIHL